MAACSTCRWNTVAGDALLNVGGWRGCGGWRGRIATLAEERRHLCDIGGVYVAGTPNRWVRGQVVADRDGRNSQPEVGGQVRDVRRVREAVVGRVGRPGVGTAVGEGVGADEVFQCRAERIAVGVIGRD